MDALPIGEESVQGVEPESPDVADAWTGGWPQTAGEFEALVDFFLDRLVRYAWRRLGDQEEAEDVVQEVLVRAYAERSKRANVASPAPYLYRMVANACIDHLRRRKDSVVSLDEMEAEVETIRSDAPSPVEVAAAAEEARRAEELLRRLPDEQAEVIRLRVFDELRIHEIAEMLGCSINTVASRLRYGFQKLRTLVSREAR